MSRQEDLERLGIEAVLNVMVNGLPTEESKDYKEEYERVTKFAAGLMGERYALKMKVEQLREDIEEINANHFDGYNRMNEKQQILLELLAEARDNFICDFNCRALPLEEYQVHCEKRAIWKKEVALALGEE